MKLAMLVGKSMLARTQGSKVLAGARLNVGTKVNDDPAKWIAIDCDVEIASQSLGAEAWTGDFGP